MNQPANMNSGMESDPMGGMFSQMFDWMQPMEPANTMPASEAVTIRAEEESRRLNRQVAELRSENSTLSSRNQELQSTNRRLLSANQTLRKQLSEVNETARLLEETRKRERACIEKEKRCDRILRREAVLETAESRVRDERERLKNERKRIREGIAEQVERESERMVGSATRVSAHAAVGSRGLRHASARSRRICGGCFYDDERLAYGRNPGSPYRSLDVGRHGGLRRGRPSRHDPAQSGGLARLVDPSHCCRAPDLSGEADGPNQPIH